MRWLSALLFMTVASCYSAKESRRGPAAEEAELQSFSQKCVRSICGSTGENLSSMEADNFRSTTHIYTEESANYKSIDRALYEVAKAEIGQISTRVDQIEKLLKNTKHIIPRPLQILINSGHFLKLQQSIMEQKRTTQPQTQVEDLVPSDFYNLNLPPLEQQWIMDVLKTGYFKKTPAIDISEKLPNYLDRKYRGMFFKKSLPLALQQCRQKVKEVSLFVGQSLAAQKQFIYCGAEEKLVWSLVDENRLVEEFKAAELLFFLMGKGIEETLLRRPWNWHSVLQKYAESDEFKTMQRISKKTEKELKGYIKGSVDSCHMSVGSSVETAPNEQQKKIATAAIADIRNRAKQLIKFKDVKLQKNWEVHVSSTWYVFPMQSSAVIKNILGRLQAEKASLTPQKQEISEVLLDIVGFDFNQSKNPATPIKQEIDMIARALKNLRDICKDYDSETLTDHIYASDGNVFLSWFTLRYPEQGYGIMAHEMGHHVSQLMKVTLQKNPVQNLKELLVDGSIWEHRDCVDRYHPPSEDVGNMYPTAEEDWADYFAGQILRMKKSEGAKYKNFACVLMGEIEDLYDTSLDSSGLGRYSPAFFRLLHLERTVNGLSDSCRQSLQIKKLPACF